MTAFDVVLALACIVLAVGLDRAQQDVKRLRRANQFLVNEAKKHHQGGGGV